MTADLTLDEIIQKAIDICSKFESSEKLTLQKKVLNSLNSRLTSGELHIAVIGQFNRGKSTFINKLLENNILPTSVLPLTSVPTKIFYSSKVGCKIEFDKQPPLNYEGDALGVANNLTKYVTEGENPNNRAGVTAATVYSPSSLLSHGTVIIDTPGFGSTHIHNTTATLDTLKECDAVFFMLSADLPITQMELNFIKRIQPHVSRLFFIYNKSDLLTASELVSTKDFIQKTLFDKLKIITKDNFYTISAKNSDDGLGKSGLPEIREEVIAFLQKEKYFSLAEALDRKLKESLTAILKELDSQEQSLADVGGDFLNKALLLECDLQTLEEDQSKSIKILKEIEQSIKIYLSEELAKKPKELSNYLYSKIEQLLDKSAFKTIESALPSINHLSEELFYRFYSSMVGEVNRKLRNHLPEVISGIKECSSFETRFIKNDVLKVENRETFSNLLFKSDKNKMSPFWGKPKKDEFIKESLLTQVHLVTEREINVQISHLNESFKQELFIIKKEISKIFTTKAESIELNIEKANSSQVAKETGSELIMEQVRGEIKAVKELIG
jgi:GTPase Era involved in 16S rRNA processing